MTRGRLAVAAGAAAVLTACSSAGATPLVLEGTRTELGIGALTARDVAAAQTAFGIDLLHAVCARAPGEDVLVSPTSAAEALGLLYPATAGPTAEAFADVLHLPPWSPDLAAATRDHTAALDGLRHDGDLDDDDAPDSLQLSNHLWTALGLEPDPAYLDDIATAFGADVRALDFAADPEGATDRINSTIAEETRDRIEQLFDEALDRETRAVLTNAVHLQARWAVPFTDTGPAPFAGHGDVEMMSGGAGTARAAEGWQSVELPYRDGTLTAIAVLPPEGTDPCAVDQPTLAALGAAEAAEVGVQLPRLHVEQSHELLEQLAALGLPVAGDFSRLGEEDLEISRVVQRTWLDVDEEGTEAAAATAVVVEETSAGPEPEQEVVSFDRPFLLLLTDTATRSPLFVTVVYDPTA